MNITAFANICKNRYRYGKVLSNIMDNRFSKIDEEGVNLTLGLPIIRTSLVRGVAYDLTAKNKQPFLSSTEVVIKPVVDLYP